MSTTYRVYRSGTLVTTFVDADDAGYSVSNATTGWAAGTYPITITAQLAGWAESDPVSPPAPGTVTVNSAGSLDDFNRADGALAAPNWSAFVGGGLYVVGNKCAYPATDTTARGSYWDGSTLGNDYFVSAHCHALYDTASRISAIWSRVTSGGNRIQWYREAAGGGWQDRWNLRIELAYTLAEAAFMVETPDEWGRIEAQGTTVRAYTSADGTSWTLRHTYSGAGVPTTGKPIVYQTAADNGVNIWIDDFRCGVLA